MCLTFDLKELQTTKSIKIIREVYNTCSGRSEASVLPAVRAISVCCSTVGPVALITVIETSTQCSLTDKVRGAHVKMLTYQQV